MNFPRKKWLKSGLFSILIILLGSRQCCLFTSCAVASERIENILVIRIIPINILSYTVCESLGVHLLPDSSFVISIFFELHLLFPSSPCLEQSSFSDLCRKMLTYYPLGFQDCLFMSTHKPVGNNSRWTITVWLYKRRLRNLTCSNRR